MLPLHHKPVKRTTRVERASAGWRPAALPAELHPRESTLGWSRTSGHCHRKAALCPLSYERRSPRQESNPHLGRTKGACLPLTLRRHRWRRWDSNPHRPRCKRGARPVERRPRGRCGRVESNHHSARPLGYSQLSSPMLSVRMKGRPTGFEPVPRGSRPRMLPLHHSHHDGMSGDDRTRTGGLSPDKRLLSPLSYASVLRGWDSNPRSRAHEAREDSRSSTALRNTGLAGRSRTCDLRFPRPAGWPSSPTTRRNPRRDSNPHLRVEGPASQPFDHGGKQGSGGRDRTCASRLTVARLSRSTTPERTEAAGFEPANVPHTSAH